MNVFFMDYSGQNLKKERKKNNSSSRKKCSTSWFKKEYFAHGKQKDNTVVLQLKMCVDTT